MNCYRRLLKTETLAVAVGNNGTSFVSGGNGRACGGGIIESSFDANLVIILAALLCALIFALGLNSIVRCALRCSRRLTMDPIPHGEAAARIGLKKRALRQIPVAVYGSSSSGGGRGLSSVPGTECPICLGEFEDGGKVRVLPNCNHGFHVSCIDKWLMSHSSCPNCRHSLLLLQGPGQPTASSSST